jgi:hypothetical protein
MAPRTVVRGQRRLGRGEEAELSHGLSDDRDRRKLHDAVEHHQTNDCSAQAAPAPEGETWVRHHRHQWNESCGDIRSCHLILTYFSSASVRR